MDLIEDRDLYHTRFLIGQLVPKATDMCPHFEGEQLFPRTVGDGSLPEPDKYWTAQFGESQVCISFLQTGLNSLRLFWQKQHSFSPIASIPHSSLR